MLVLLSAGAAQGLVFGDIDIYFRESFRGDFTLILP